MSNPHYKAKTLKGNWVFGYYYEQKGKAYILQEDKAYEVRRETRCQIIGRKDKNGKDIYENDIITANGHYPKLVRFIPKRVGFCLANLDDLKNEDLWDIWQQPYTDWWDKMEIEIIGNKFDCNEYQKIL